MQTLHAILIGIDNYPTLEHRLTGCINDVENVAQFLASHCAVNELKPNLKKITNEAATRQGIIDAFDHFKNAKDGDLCILYFSGNGSTINPPVEIAALTPSQKMASIVAYDSRLQNGKDIVEKEWAYLINKKGIARKNVHFLSIFDCAHAGRIADNETLANRMIPIHTGVYQLADLLGQATYFTDATKTAYQSQAPNAIHLTAASPFQSAAEMTIKKQQQGLFTWALLDTLEAASLSQLSYGELLANLLPKMHFKVATQQPKIKATGDFSKNTLFLEGAFTHHQKALLEFDELQGWLINKGKNHRVQPKTAIQIKDSQLLHIAHIKKVNSNFSRIGALAWADTSKTYPVISLVLKPEKLKVAFKKRVKHPVLRSLKQLLKTNNDLVELVYKKGLADFWISATETKIMLSKAGEQRPVFKKVPITTVQKGCVFTSALLFKERLLQVAHYEHISKIANPNSDLAIDQLLDIQLAEVTDHANFNRKGKLVSKDPNDPLFLEYHAETRTLVNPAIQLKVQNKANHSLWVTGLFLAEDYSIRAKFLPVKELKAGAAAYEFAIPKKSGKRNPLIKLRVDDALLNWGVHDIRNQIKVIVSTQPFTVDQILQNGLVQEVEDTRGGTNNPVPQAFGESLSTADSNWTVQNIALHIHRPQLGLAFNGQEAVNLKGMQIAPHPAFSAGLVRLSSSENATRSSNLSEQSPTHVLSSPFLQPFQPHGTRASQETLDILELHDVSNPDAVTPDEPLKVKLEVPLETGKVVVPFGYDKETDLFIPMGFVDKDGQTVFIEALPNESAATTRGLFKSIKIFLVETVRKVTGKKPKYPILAIANVDNQENLTYITETEAIQTAVKKAKRILIMVHGLIGDTSDKAKIMKRIKQDHHGQTRTLSDVYDVLLTFDYESMHRRIQKTGKDLKKKLEGVGIKQGHSKEIHIIAHSMGGLVSRWYLEKEGGLKVINHFIQIGTPNLGSPIANKAMLATTALGAVLNFIPKPPIVAGVIKFIGFVWNRVTVSTRQLKPTSNFYKALNKNVPDITIPYTILPGDITLNASDPKELKFFKRMIERYKQKLFKEGNDGVVAVSSIKGVPVPSGRMVERLDAVPCNHFSYFNTPDGERVLAEVLFSLVEAGEVIGEDAPQLVA